MHIYAVISIVLFVTFYIEQKTDNVQLKNRLFYLGAFIVASLLAFRSDDIGTDTLLYCNYFDGKGSMYGVISAINEDLELGFQYLSRLLHLISDSHLWCILSNSFIFMIPFLYIIKRDCMNSKILPLFLYMSIWTLLMISQTAFRQNMSVSFLMYAYIAWTKEFDDKWKQRYMKCLSIALLIIAYFMHKSAAIAIVLAIAGYFIKWNKKTSIIALLTSLILAMFMTDLFGTIFTFLSVYLGDIEATSRMIDTYYGNEQYSYYGETSFNALGPVTIFVCLLASMSNEDDRNSFFYKMLMIGTIGYNIGASFPLMQRVLYGILLFAIMFTPSRIKNNRTAYIVLLLLCLFFIRNEIVYWRPNPATHFLPYTFFWE